MTFLEFQQYMRVDSTLFTYIVKNVKSKNLSFAAAHYVTVEKGQLAFINKGVIAEVSKTTDYIDRLYLDKDIIYLPNGPSEQFMFETLAPTEILFLDADEAFSFLEKEGLSSSFFHALLEQTEVALKKNLWLSQYMPINRISVLIDQEVANKIDSPFIPSWLNARNIARIAHCSVSTTSKVIKQMAESGKIDTHEKPWKINLCNWSNLIFS